MHNSRSEGLLAEGQICTISSAKLPLSSKNVQNILSGQCWSAMHKSRDEGESSFPRLRNATLVKGQGGTRLGQVTDGKLKETKIVNEW